MNYREFSERIKQLTAQGYCQPVSVKMSSGRSRPSTFLCLTAKGHEAIGSNQKLPRGGTSLIHLFVQWLVAHIFSSKHIRTEIEVSKNNSPQLDLGFFDPATKINGAVEVVWKNGVEYEFDKAMKIIASVDRLLITSSSVQKVRQVYTYFADALGKTAHDQLTICHIYHLNEAVSLQDIYDFPGLMYEPGLNQTQEK